MTLRSVLVVALALVALAACDPGHSLSIRNGTEQPVVISVDGSDFHEPLQPGAQTTLGMLIGQPPIRVTARHGDSVIYDRTFSMDALKEMDFAIVISASP